MLTPDSFREAGAGFLDKYRRQRLALPADEVPPQWIVLFDAVGNAQVMVVAGEPARKAPKVVERAVVRHGAVAAVTLGESWYLERDTDEPRPSGSLANHPDAEEVLLAFHVWPQAGIGETQIFNMIRSAFGTVDLVRRPGTEDAVFVGSWLSDLLPQPVTA